MAHKPKDKNNASQNTQNTTSENAKISKPVKNKPKESESTEILFDYSVIEDFEDPKNIKYNKDLIEKKIALAIEDPKYIYKVKLNDESDPIFTSPVLSVAYNETMKYHGYKIYRDNEMIMNPWKDQYDKRNEYIEKEKEFIDKGNYVFPQEGRRVILDKEPVYALPISKEPFEYLTGDYYYFDSAVILGRARITKEKEPKHDYSKIVGYIKLFGWRG